MALSIIEIHNQLLTDVEATDGFLLAALARGDGKAVSIWQNTLNAAKKAEETILAYKNALAE